MPGVITVDADASGYGWYVDTTPGNSSEFGRGRGHGTAAGAVDLLTVLTHELGHLVGHSEIFGDSNDVMGIALPVGVRRLPISGVSAGLFHDRLGLTSEGLANDWSQLSDRVMDEVFTKRDHCVRNVTIGPDWDSSLAIDELDRASDREAIEGLNVRLRKQTKVMTDDETPAVESEEELLDVDSIDELMAAICGELKRSIAESGCRG